MYLNVLSPNKLYHGILLKLYATIKKTQACKVFEYTDFNIDMLECNFIITIIQNICINVNTAWISKGLQHHIVMSFGQLLKQIQFILNLFWIFLLSSIVCGFLGLWQLYSIPFKWYKHVPSAQHSIKHIVVSIDWPLERNKEIGGSFGNAGFYWIGDVYGSCKVSYETVPM